MRGSCPPIVRGSSDTGARITITNVAANQVRRVQTNDAGVYAMPFLAPAAPCDRRRMRDGRHGS